MDNDTLKTIGFYILIFLAIITWKLLFPSSKPLTRDECFRLGSNERTNLCLLEISQKEEANKPPPDTFPIYKLIVSDTKMTGNSYYNNNPVYEASIKNTDTAPAGPIYMRVRFYPYNTKECNNSPSDTTYVKVSDLIQGGDTQRVKTTVFTNFDTSGAFTWCADISSANVFR
jgi:hypothetical protein